MEYFILHAVASKVIKLNRTNIATNSRCNIKANMTSGYKFNGIIQGIIAYTIVLVQYSNCLEKYGDDLYHVGHHIISTLNNVGARVYSMMKFAVVNK